MREARQRATQHLDTVSLLETLLDGRREHRDLRSPSLWVVALESLEQGLEHLVKFRGRMVPSDDGIAEPQQALNLTISIDPRIQQWNTHLRNTGRICLDEGTQTAEGRVLLLVVANLVQSLTPCLSKLAKVGRDKIGVHQANTTN